MIDNFTVRPADFEDAMALKDAIGKEIAESKLDVKLDAIGDMMNQDIDLNGAVSLIAQFMSSKDIREALFKCLRRCTYNNEKITPEFFNNIENRKYYYPMAFECIKENIAPFFGKTAFELLGMGDINLGALASTLQK